MIGTVGVAVISETQEACEKEAVCVNASRLEEGWKMRRARCVQLVSLLLPGKHVCIVGRRKESLEM